MKRWIGWHRIRTSYQPDDLERGIQWGWAAHVTLGGRQYGVGNQRTEDDAIATLRWYVARDTERPQEQRHGVG